MYNAGDGTQVMTTTDDILSKLNNHFETNMLCIRLNTPGKYFSLTIYKENEEKYTFSFDGHAIL